MTYWQKLKDPAWQERRLKIMERDSFRCVECGTNLRTLHVHHRVYFPGKEPWEYSDDFLVTLCSVCHKKQPVSDEADALEYLVASLLSLEQPILCDFANTVRVTSLATGKNPTQLFAFAMHHLHDLGKESV